MYRTREQFDALQLEWHNPLDWPQRCSQYVSLHIKIAWTKIMSDFLCRFSSGNWFLAQTFLHSFYHPSTPAAESKCNKYESEWLAAHVFPTLHDSWLVAYRNDWFRWFAISISFQPICSPNFFGFIDRFGRSRELKLGCDFYFIFNSWLNNNRAPLLGMMLGDTHIRGTNWMHKHSRKTSWTIHLLHPPPIKQMHTEEEHRAYRQTMSTHTHYYQNSKGRRRILIIKLFDPLKKYKPLDGREMRKPLTSHMHEKERGTNKSRMTHTHRFWSFLGHPLYGSTLEEDGTAKRKGKRMKVDHRIKDAAHGKRT
jgi:hypothetical protein